jgi:hypothetical protein
MTMDPVQWPGGVVPYEIRPGLRARPQVENAIRQWNETPGMPVHLTPRTEEKDFVVFVDGQRCSSSRGVTGGPQEISLTAGCRPGVVLHEIGHAVGLHHEHNRVDRRQFLDRIALENVYRSAVSNFTARTDPEPGEYDFESIMHYSQMAFSKNRAPTIVPIAAKVPTEALIGQRQKLSAGDVARLRVMYDDGGSGGGSQ